MARTKKCCDGCEKWKFCRVPDEYRYLCRQIEKYLSKIVDVEQKELPLKKEYDRYCPGKWPVPPGNTELIIRMFFTERKKVTQIADILGISHAHVSRMIKKYKKIIAENLKK